MPKVIYKIGDDISTDIIYPGRYMATVLPTETPQYAFDDIKDLNKSLNEKPKSDQAILIGGKNFGCGSSREQAVSTLKGHNLTVIAKDFARIFLQNSINLGLNTVICPEIEAEINDDIELQPDIVINHTQGKSFPIIPLPAARKAIVEAGGLIPYTQKLLKEKLGV
ncbi:MAG: 3-isopropylmalate dehydratase [Candidatus Kapabacteria bacterium]|nr:3-isopropylmalate dehydratase [Ignavibacteriota bacterium]MCW5885809.1 3-isopropylmalate dehydratase [Candidatus Kapabacteria bacterium]